MPSSQSEQTILQSCWQSVTLGQSTKQIDKRGLKQWTNRVISEKSDKNIYHKIDIAQMIEQFLKDRESENKDNQEFGFEDAHQFYNWLEQQVERINKSNREQQQQIKENQQQFQNNNESRVSKTSAKQNERNRSLKSSQNEQLDKFVASKQQKMMTQQNQLRNQFKEEEKSAQKIVQEINISKNYQQFLQTIFEHYCKLSYQQSNPTFQHMQQKAQIMNLSKFMMFCKDFGLQRLNAMNRNVLVQQFKKNSQFCKEMNSKQFIQLLQKISILSFDPEQQQNSQTQIVLEESKPFKQLLVFLQVNNMQTFKKKAASLGIMLRPKPSANPLGPQKNINVVSKIKLKAENGKTQQQIRQQLQQRKRIRSQNKLKTAQNAERVTSIKTRKKDMLSPVPNRGQPVRQQVKSVNSIKMMPPLPPIRRISETKPKIDEPTAITGYANIHRIKQMGRQPMKLNNVINQAKQIVQSQQQEEQSDFGPSNGGSSLGRETPYSSYGHQLKMQEYVNRDITQSEQTNRPDIFLSKSNVQRNYVAHGHSQLQKHQKKTENHELHGIIGGQSDDEDEYLQEHLNREQRANIINQRISQKIKEYQLKQLQ